jgi:hypothetical protein
MSQHEHEYFSYDPGARHYIASVPRPADPSKPITGIARNTYDPDAGCAPASWSPKMGPVILGTGRVVTVRKR